MSYMKNNLLLKVNLMPKKFGVHLLPFVSYRIKARIDLGKSERPFSLTYVALSRVRRLEDLLLEHIGVERLKKIKPPIEILKYLE